MDHVSPAWKACISHYLISIRNHSGSEDSFYNYTSILRRFVEHIDKPLELVTRADVLSFMALPSTSPRGNRGQPVRASTRNSKLSAIQSLFAFASSYEVSQPDGSLGYLWQKALPTVGLRHEKKDIRPRQMSQEDIAKFFAAIPETKRGKRDKVLFYAYLILGRRRQELLRLRWSDLTSTIIDGRAAIVYSYVGKGSSRTVRQKEMPPDVYQMICDLLREEGRFEHMQAGDYIFANLSGSGRIERKGQPLAGDMVGHYFHLYAKKAGLPDYITLHSLRWSSAYHRAMSGSSVTDVRDLLDHSSLTITSLYLSGMITQADSGAAALSRQFAFLR